MPLNPPSADPAVQRAGDRIAGYADDIAKLFRKGVLVTVLVRMPGDPDATMVITRDSLDEMIKALELRRDSPENIYALAQGT